MANRNGAGAIPSAGSVLMENRGAISNEQDKCGRPGQDTEVHVDAIGVQRPVGLLGKRRASPPCISSYKLDFDNRGHALIVNNQSFHWKTGLAKRHGSDIDARNLKRIFRKLGFEVDLQENVSCSAIMQLTEKYANEDHSNSDCFVFAILSHGDNGCVYGTDATVEIKGVVDQFRGDRCQTLAGKPKIFIFQACRGKTYEVGVEAADDVTDGISDESFAVEDTLTVDSGPMPTIPSGSDFLFCYSVAEGFYSFRDKFFGSWYIDEFTNVMESLVLDPKDENAKEVDFIDVMTVVNRRVAQRHVTSGQSLKMQGKKQMPCYLSMLTKKLYLYPKRTKVMKLGS